MKMSEFIFLFSRGGIEINKTKKLTRHNVSGPTQIALELYELL